MQCLVRLGLSLLTLIPPAEFLHSGDFRVEAIDLRGNREAGEIVERPSGLGIRNPRDGRLRPFADFSRLRLASRPGNARIDRHRLELVNGDALPARLVRIDESSAAVGLFDELARSVPRAAIAAVTGPPGNAEELHWGSDSASSVLLQPRFASLASFLTKDAALALGGKPMDWAIPFEDPLEDFVFAFRYSAPERFDLFGRGVRFEMTPRPDAPAPRIELRLDADGGDSPMVVSRDVSMFETFPVAARRGGRVAVVRRLGSRMTVVIDGTLRAVGNLPAGVVNRVALFSKGASPAAPEERREESPPFLIDQMTLWRRSLPVSHPMESGQEEALERRDGDGWAGRLLTADADGLTFRVGRTERKLAWSEVDLVRFPVASPPPCTVRGPIVRIVLADSRSVLPRPATQPNDHLTAALEGVGAGVLRVEHPLLGSISIPCASVERIEPLWTGGWTLLQAAPEHLGRSIRTDFRQSRPVGTERSIVFTLAPADLLKPAALRIETLDVDPGHPQSPVATPRLSDVRAGGRITELFLNGTRIGDLNSAIQWQRAVHGRQTVRLIVPGGRLNAGRNQLRIVQKPSRWDPADYDDCEVGPISLEIHDTRASGD